jgi:hypothetical protein
MFKASSDKLDYINRVGSHATKARGTGRIDDIPPWAREPEEYYNSIRDQYQALADQFADVQAQLAVINEKLRVTLPFKDFENLRLHKERLAARCTMLQEQAKAYRSLARAAGEKAWATVFYHCAQFVLGKDEFRRIEEQTKEILARPQFEIEAGRSDRSEAALENLRRKEKRQHRRHVFRARRQDHALVWCDNAPVPGKGS